MKQEIEISVIIPCYNSADTIGEQLYALSRQTYPDRFEVIISDNGSEDDLPSITAKYQKHFTDLIVVNADKVKGPAYARNKGAKAAKGKLLLFCDADDVVEENWIEIMSEALDDHDVVASRLEHYSLNRNPNWVINTGMQSEELIQNRHFKPAIPHAVGSGLGIRKKLHVSIGGFDDHIYMAEDWDYCWKAQLSGADLYFEPNAIVHYRHRKSLKQSIKQAFIWGESYTVIVKKYHSLGIQEPSIGCAINEWKHLVRKLFTIKKNDITFRNQTVWNIAHKIGRVKGSLKNRVAAF